MIHVFLVTDQGWTKTRKLQKVRDNHPGLTLKQKGALYGSSPFLFSLKKFI